MQWAIHQQVRWPPVRFPSILVDILRHDKEDRLDEDGIRKAMAHPEWIALIDPADPAIPPGTSGNMVALVICLRHPGAWDDDLIEVLARPQGRDMLVFHVEHLTDKWRTYWIKWRQRK